MVKIVQYYVYVIDLDKSILEKEVAEILKKREWARKSLPSAS